MGLSKQGGRQLPQVILAFLKANMRLHHLDSGSDSIKNHLPAGDLSGGLPGSNVSKDDLPNGPKPGGALKNLPSGSAGSQVSSQVCCTAGLWAAAA